MPIATRDSAKAMWETALTHRNAGWDNLYVVCRHASEIHTANCVGKVSDEVVRAYDRLIHRVTEVCDEPTSNPNRGIPLRLWDTFVNWVIGSEPPNNNKYVDMSYDGLYRIKHYWMTRSVKHAEDKQFALSIACYQRAGLLSSNYYDSLTDEIFEIYDEFIQELHDIQKQETVCNEVQETASNEA